MKYHDVKPEAFQAEAQAGSGARGSGQKANWLKMTAPGDYVLRLAPPWSEEGKPARKLLSHNDPFKTPIVKQVTFDDGNEREIRIAPLCFRYIFTNEHIARILLDRNSISSVDYERYKQYGCPLCILPINLTEQGTDKKVVGPYWARTQYLFNVQLVEAPAGSEEEVGQLYVWSVSQTRFDDIEKAFKLDPNLFHPTKGRNMIIEAQGPKGKDRRYSNPQFAPSASALDFDGELYDLDDLMIKGVRKFDEVAELLLTNRLDWDEELRLGDLQSVLSA